MGEMESGKNEGKGVTRRVEGSVFFFRYLHFLLEDAVVDGGVQLELLGALDGLQAHHHEVQHLAVPATQ